MKIDGNQIKVGNILEINSKLWRVLKTQHTQPGKGGAYLQVEMKEIQSIKDGGGNGSIVGRNCFQRPKDKALELIDKMISIYKD